MSNRSTLVAGLVLASVVLTSTNAVAIPAWARKYGTSCSTCHAPYPKLNHFGKAFRNNGYRFPGGLEESATREPPVIMGAEGYRQLFPQAMWPSDIPGGVPLSFRGISRLSWYDDDRTTTFEFPHEFEFLTGGTLGETFSFFGEVEVENEDNELEFGMDLALQYDPRPWLHFRMGSVRAHPIPDHLRLTAAHYSPYDTRTTPSSLPLSVPNPNGTTPTLSFTGTTEQDRWRFRNGQSGVEAWGARNGVNGRGGVTWAVGVANGQGLIDANDRKDVYGRVAYKFGGYGELGTDELPQDLEFWRDDSVKVGFSFYNGRSLNLYEGSTLALSGAPGAGIVTVSGEAEIENQVDVVGVEFDWWYRDLNLFGLYLRQTDDNPRGTNESIDTDAWFAEANYTVYPWLVGVARYGETDQDLEFRNNPDKLQFFVPAVILVARANVKFTVEAQIRLDDAGEGRDRYVAGIDFGF
jgi:hypothetical protein